jgi:hypothetical protein
MTSIINIRMSVGTAASRTRTPTFIYRSCTAMRTIRTFTIGIRISL